MFSINFKFIIFYPNIEIQLNSLFHHVYDLFINFSGFNTDILSLISI